MIYRAETESKAEEYLLRLQEKWEDKYPLAVRPWLNHWENVKTFFKFPEEIRRIIYTTNAVESLHRQFRKTTKAGQYSRLMSLSLSYCSCPLPRLSEKWTMAVKGWTSALSQFVIIYGDRLENEVEA